MYLAKTEAGFATADGESETLHGRMGLGECADFTVRRVRSLPWHRKYFGICGSIGANQEPVRDADSIDHELRILAGHYEVMKLRDKRSGELYEVLTPKRIAFHKLTADQWAALYPSLEQAGIQRFGAEYWIEAAVA